MSTDIFPFAVWLSGTNENSIPANDNALRNEVLAKGAIAIADAAPVSPTDGDLYVIGTAWGGFATGDVVIYEGGTWLGFNPFAGWAEDDRDRPLLLQRIGLGGRYVWWRICRVSED